MRLIPRNRLVTTNIAFGNYECHDTYIWSAMCGKNVWFVVVITDDIYGFNKITYLVMTWPLLVMDVGALVCLSTKFCKYKVCFKLLQMLVVGKYFREVQNYWNCFCNCDIITVECFGITKKKLQNSLKKFYVFTNHIHIRPLRRRSFVRASTVR